VQLLRGLLLDNSSRLIVTPPQTVSFGGRLIIGRLASWYTAINRGRRGLGLDSGARRTEGRLAFIRGDYTLALFIDVLLALALGLTAAFEVFRRALG